MSAFRAGEIEVLVATTVIEVGVDVPEATVMVIEDADRFGIAQLHQLRGRVGRSDRTSWCYLLSRNTSPEATRRLEALEASTDGFELAEVDLELRGEGTILGARQKGRSDLKLATLRPADRRLVTDARARRRDASSKRIRLSKPTPSWPRSYGCSWVRRPHSYKKGEHPSSRRRFEPREAASSSPVAEGVRPTSDRVSESIFDILGSLVDLNGLRVADLFAGTGAMGIEALSRGAGSVTFVESDERAVSIGEGEPRLDRAGRAERDRPAS